MLRFWLSLALLCATPFVHGSASDAGADEYRSYEGMSLAASCAREYRTRQIDLNPQPVCRARSDRARPPFGSTSNQITAAPVWPSPGDTAT
jgi:hypothetical protein